jgi:hypothetical protein
MVQLREEALRAFESRRFVAVSPASVDLWSQVCNMRRPA